MQYTHYTQDCNICYWENKINLYCLVRSTYFWCTNLDYKYIHKRDKNYIYNAEVRVLNRNLTQKKKFINNNIFWDIMPWSTFRGTYCFCFQGWRTGVTTGVTNSNHAQENVQVPWDPVTRMIYWKYHLHFPPFGTELSFWPFVLVPTVWIDATK